MKRLVIGGLMLAMACGSDGPTDSGNAVTSVVVTAPSTTIAAGSQVQASASVLGKNGTAITGKTVSWRSDKPNVATVSNTGLISGVTAGTAVITATADNIAGVLNVTVTADLCANPITVGQGEVRTLEGPASVNCVALATIATASEYLLIAANSNPVPDSLRLFNVSAQVNAPTFASAARSAPSAHDIVLQEQQAAVAFSDAFEDRLRAAERGMLARMPSAARKRLAASPRMGQSSVSAARSAVAEGDTINLSVTNAGSNNLCTNFAPIRAVAKKVVGKVEIMQDVAAPANGFTDADFTAIATEFNALIYPTDTDWFGLPTDVDNDGRIVILYTPEVNKLTPANSSGFVGGFFWGGDLFLKSEFDPASPCPATNEREIFYVLAPDPAGTINNNVRSVGTVRQGTRGTIAHEFQHMINQSVRMTSPLVIDSLEVAWLNESMSHLAEEIVGRADLHFTDFQSLTFSQVSNNVDDFNAFFRQNFLRFRSWMQRPDTSAPTSRKAASQLAPRGAGWALVRYTIDQFSGNDARQFTRRLALGPQVNVTNLVNKAGVTFEQIISGWLVANYADDLGVVGLDPRFSYKSWNMRDVMSLSNNGTFPLLVTGLPTTVSTQALSGSGNYFRLSRAANAPQATFRMTSTSGASVDFNSARVYVLRVN